MTLKKTGWSIALIGCLTSMLAAAADGTLIRAADLKAKPLLDAATVKSLPADTPLSVLGNEGGWSQVKTQDGAQGWVRLLNVRLKAAGESGSNLGRSLGEIGNVARTGSTKGAATTGAKGLSREEVTNATPNMAELRKMEGFKSTPAAAERFAKAQKLKAQEVEEFNP